MKQHMITASSFDSNWEDCSKLLATFSNLRTSLPSMPVLDFLLNVLFLACITHLLVFTSFCCSYYQNSELISWLSCFFLRQFQKCASFLKSSLHIILLIINQFLSENLMYLDSYRNKEGYKGIPEGWSYSIFTKETICNNDYKISPLLSI